MYKFTHDEPARTVYKFPSVPSVNEQKDRRGKRIGWSANMEVLITRAVNKLNRNQWLHPTSAYPQQSFDSKYTREEVIHYFMMHHAPNGSDITEEEYFLLHKEYDALARAS